MNDKTLYVSDLDGTLMRNNEQLSEYTVRTINELVEQGLSFTYATARSIESARTITGNLKLELPVITRNGAVLADNNTGKHLEKFVFTKEEVELMKTLIPEIARCGFVSCFMDDLMIRTFMKGEHTEGFQGYLDYYKNDPSMKETTNMDDLFCGVPGYITMIGDKELIGSVYDKVKEYRGWESIFQKDIYRDEYWLEICPQNCTKAKSVLKLKEKLGYQKLVVFGDALNDISMFKIADEAYAVSNALDEVKPYATGIIGSNEEDAVADFLKGRV